VAVLDADVLVPILSCDLLLSAFDADLYQPVVTPTVSARSNELCAPTSGISTRWRWAAVPARSAPCSRSTPDPIQS